ncbi:RluA family pseudouridine synthase [Gramella lutea]|uniref:RluA family pseudouridine synthase n=1 Tax=Christiangramia lutea TaxID=1607951 RepID=A0A9X1V0I0_9FLAO|nr:RluA family pseudouridine synthase [Christiangramia lutea]MCH4822037.1 RluA family pseudouridine synthase [Christiangramia lutea]
MKILETHIVPAIFKKIRLQEYAVSVFTSIQTRSGLKKAIKKGLLLIDGRKATTADWIKEGQKIDLLQTENTSKKIFRLNMEIVFEDNHIAIINKPTGYPTSGNYFRTIENALPHNLSPSKDIGSLPYPLPAHRLDNPTSGILLCAKTRNSLANLQKSFASKNIQKTYFALVHGKVFSNRVIDSEIDGKPAKTVIGPINFFKIQEAFYTLLEAKPLTGKTHQIRIHLHRGGYPIVGDKIYGKGEKGYFKNKNLFLFSGKVKFLHPVTTQEMNFSLQLPKKFRVLENYRIS